MDDHLGQTNSLAGWLPSAQAAASRLTSTMMVLDFIMVVFARLARLVLSSAPQSLWSEDAAALDWPCGLSDSMLVALGTYGRQLQQTCSTGVWLVAGSTQHRERGREGLLLLFDAAVCCCCVRT